MITTLIILIIIFIIVIIFLIAIVLYVIVSLEERIKILENKMPLHNNGKHDY